MPQGVAVIFKTTTNGPYAYTWKDDAEQQDLDTVVTGKTLTQAYNEIGTLAAAMPGTIQNARIVVTSV
jgi:hypothetical protein